MADHITVIGVVPVVIDLAEKIITTCRDMTFPKGNDRMVDIIKETTTQMSVVKLRLDVIHAYLRSPDSAPLRFRESGRKALEVSLAGLEELLRKLEGRLSSSDHLVHWTFQGAWNSWRKDEVKHLNSQISRWSRHMQGIISAWNMHGMVEAGSEVYKRLSKVHDQSLKAAMDLQDRVQSNRTQITSPSLLLALGLSSRLIDASRRWLFTKDKPKYYVEQQELAPGDLGRKQKEGLERLSYIFKDSHLPSLNLLSCKGVNIVPVTHHIRKGDPTSPRKPFLALVYELPDDCFQPKYSDEPTLFHALFEKESDQRFFISLEDRYQTAARIATAVTEVHAAGWVHKDICSRNIIVDIRTVEGSKRANVGPAFLVGFVAGGTNSNGLQKEPSDKGNPRHQHERTRPAMATYDIRQDIYNFGEVLVELGTQRTLDSLLTANGKPLPHEKRDAELLHHARHLEDKMGIKYSRAALACLQIHQDAVKETDTNLVVRAKFYEKVLLPLRQIVDGFKVCRVQVSTCSTSL